MTYLLTNGDPVKNTPLNLPEEIVEELGELYGAKRVRDGLQWIATYRSAKGLSHCPLCGNNGPTTLEHYLPRSPFSEFTIFSWNLIPSCGTCNSKRNKYANTPTTSTPLIHPYLDGSMYGQALLTATLRTPFEVVRFRPAALDELSGPMLARVEHQIKTCINTTRFHEALVGKWNVWRGKAIDYKTTKGLRASLQRELNSTVGPMGSNSWDAVFLRAVLADDKALEWMHANPIQTNAPKPYRGVAK